MPDGCFEKRDERRRSVPAGRAAGEEERGARRDETREERRGQKHFFHAMVVNDTSNYLAKG